MPDLLIRDIQDQDLDRIAKIHQLSFSDRALTQLGIGVIRRYYTWLLSGFPKSHPICIESHSGDIAGFCFAGIYAGSFSGFLRAHKWPLIFALIIRPWVFFDPVVRAQFLLAAKTLFKRKRPQKSTHASQMKNKRQKPGTKKSWGILSIAVDPAFQNQGVGTLIMAALENDAIKRGYSRLHLTVHPENIHAVNFYEKLGWRKSTKHDPWKGLMEKNIK